MSTATATKPEVKPGAQYTPADHDTVGVIKKWLEEAEQSRAWLGKRSGVPSGTLSQILSGKYVSSPTKQLAAMLAAVQVEDERMRDGTPGYVKGSVHRLLEVVCDRTRKHQNFGVVTGYVGVGKTRFLKEYRTSHPQTLMVEASPNMTSGVMLCELLEQLNTAAPAGLDRKFREVVRVLRNTNSLLMVDEAENLNADALNYLRRIRDMAGVGVILAGTEKLNERIKPQHGQFDQIRSRVGMWPKTIDRISHDDADEMARAALADTGADAGELRDDVLDALWAYGAGSARMLNENLIPAIKDYAQGRMLTAALVEQIAKTVLFMEKPRAEGGKV